MRCPGLTMVLGVLLDQGLATSACAQHQCLTDLVRVLDSVEDSILQASGGPISMVFEISTRTAGTQTPATVEVIEHAGYRGRTVTANPYFAVYQDLDTRVIILPKDQQVYVYDQLPDRRSEPKDDWMRYGRLVQEHGEVSSCRRFQDATGSKLQVEIEFKERLQGTALQAIRYTVDLDRPRPLEVVLHNRPGATIEEQRIVFNSFDVGKIDPRLKRPALAQVIQRGRPIAGFGSFELHDQRQNAGIHVQAPMAR